VERLVSLGRLR
jgi:hypothetical protein